MKLRWPLLTLGLVGAGALLMAPGPRRGQPGANPNPRAPALEVLRSGSGMSHVRPLCETALAMGLLTGDFAYCFDGAGNNYEDGGTRMAVTSGFMHSMTDTACPSGPNCNSTRTGRAALDAGIGIARTGGTTVEMGGNQDFSCGWFGTIKRDDAIPDLAGRGTGAPSGIVSSRMWMTSSGTPSAIIIYTDGGFSAIGAGAYVATPGPALMVQTYDFVAEGSSLHKLYTNGYADGQSTTASGNLRSATSRWIGANGGDWGDMTVYGQFCTSTVLTLAQVQALDSAVRGKLTGSRGEAITTTRNSTMFCTNEDESAGTTLAPNSPCVRKGGLLSEPAGTNLLLRSEELDNAAWTAVGTPSEVANTQIQPDGTLTADTIGDDDAAAYEGEQQTLTTTPAAAYTLSCLAKAGTSSLLRFDNDGTACNKTLTASWARYYCTDTSASGASTVQQVLIGNATTDTGTAHVTDCQFELGSYASSYVRTEGATATRVASKHALTKPTTITSTGGCLKATFKTPGAQSGTPYIFMAGGGGIYLNTTSCTQACTWYGAGGVCTGTTTKNFCTAPATCRTGWRSDPDGGTLVTLRCSGDSAEATAASPTGSFLIPFGSLWYLANDGTNYANALAWDFIAGDNIDACGGP